MKRILISLVAVLVTCGAVYVFGDSMFTGIGDSYPGVGTYKITTDGTNATLTIDKIVAGTSISGGSVATNVVLNASAYVTNVTGLAGFATNITAAAYVTNVVIQTYVPTFILADGTTNTVAIATNIVVQAGAAPTLQTVTPALQKSTPTVTVQRP